MRGDFASPGAAERTQLVLLPLAVALTLLAALTVEHGAGRSASSSTWLSICNVVSMGPNPAIAWTKMVGRSPTRSVYMMSVSGINADDIVAAARGPCPIST